ncbi:hypothetical protein [Bradyrhizobium elkanii]|uniref:hypothetical protein n=1 Tax=Bradyrhizobium elkanii TaxID=29448 RepID=UPI003F4907CB
MITAANADAIRPGENFTIDNYGQIIANGTIDPATGRPSADAIDLQGGHNGTVNNYAGGLISGAKNGTAGDAGTITVNNFAGATIIGRNGAGVGGGNAIVTNYGAITGAIDGVSTRSDGDGIDIDNVLTLTNYGIVQGTGATGADDGGRFNNSEGLAIGGGTIRNYGTISGAAAGIVVNNDSNPDHSRSGSVALDLINYAGATIVGNNSYAIRSENKTGNAAVDNDRIVNYGTIIGNGTIPDPNGVTLLQNGTPDTGSVGTLNGVTYTGTGSIRFIRGDGAAIQTGEGADVLSNYGTIIGNTGRAISMEGGDDTLNLYGGSSITGRIDGGVGTDTAQSVGSGHGHALERDQFRGAQRAGRRLDRDRRAELPERRHHRLRRDAAGQRLAWQCRDRQCRRHAWRQWQRRQCPGRWRHAVAGQFDRDAHGAGQPDLHRRIHLSGRSVGRGVRSHQRDRRGNARRRHGQRVLHGHHVPEAVHHPQRGRRCQRQLCRAG